MIKIIFQVAQRSLNCRHEESLSADNPYKHDAALRQQARFVGLSLSAKAPARISNWFDFGTSDFHL
jgi:hypothetical protein